MNKWNKKIGLAVLSFGLLTFLPSAASAQGYYNSGYNNSYNNGCCVDPCCDPCGCGGFEFGVDFLWWKPCVDDLDVGYTFSQTTNANVVDTNISYKTICPEWEPGVRVRLAKPDLWCNATLSGSYTWIQTDDKASVSSPEGGVVGSSLLTPTLDFEYSRVNGHWDTTYQAFDVLLGYPLQFCQCNTFTPYVGIAGLILDQKLNSHLTNPEVTTGDFGSTKWSSDYWGLGLKFGSDFNYAVCDGFSLIASGSASIVAGESDNKNHQSRTLDAATTPLVANVKYKNSESCHIIPGYHISAGAQYDTCWCDWELGFRIGYEFVKWHNVSNPRRFLHADGSDINVDRRLSGQSTSPSTTTFGFHGLFAGLDFKF